MASYVCHDMRLHDGGSLDPGYITASLVLGSEFFTFSSAYSQVDLSL